MSTKVRVVFLFSYSFSLRKEREGKIGEGDPFSVPVREEKQTASLSFSLLLSSFSSSLSLLSLVYFHPCPALSSTKSPRALTSSSLSLAAKVHAPLGAQFAPYPGIFPLPE